ncbi:uncharacterized protein PRCAT00004958001 [Priceomyces carsonii]|uniref:uncharacterized protein n=1 Tax=Priceomyces carsonii TaxID=28549 RepID=UPI002ED8DC4A|nr:unnamed protein product [Priceomyces carsonii]
MEYYSSLDASQLDSERPTLFELISAKQLEALLSPSLRYVLVYYATRYPQYLLKVTNRFDELNLLLRSFIEWYFLKFWQGSFTENFYGIKRVRQTPLSGGKFNQNRLTQITPSLIEKRRSLTRLQKAASIFEITGAAYLSEKFNYWYELWYPKYITKQLVPSDPNNRREFITVEFKKKFVEWWPRIQSIIRAGNFLTTLLYLSGATKSPSIITYLMKMDYSRLNQYDYSKNEPKAPSAGKERLNKVRPDSMNEYLMRLLVNNVTRPSWKVSKYLLGTFFPIAIFTLKFLEWWNNSSFASQLSKGQGNVLDTIIPPPSTLSEYAKLKKMNKKCYKSGLLCPLCKEEITNPAIIETGYVFCYSCIHNYLVNSNEIVAKRISKLKEEDSDSESVDGEYEERNEKGSEHFEGQQHADISKGGRCPITGKKLLGCKWNAAKGSFDVEGLRRLIF